jgi:hypothetical protein
MIFDATRRCTLRANRTGTHMGRIGTLILGLAVLVVAVAGFVGFRDATATRTLMVDARRELQAGREALLADDVEAAATAFASAREASRAAAGRVDGPVWEAAARLPWLGANATVARAGVDLAAAAAHLGLAASEEAADLLDGSALDGLVADGRVDLDRLDAVREVVAGLPVAPVRAAADRLREVNAADVMAAFRDDRLEAIALADEVVAQVSRAEQGLDLLLGFFGQDGSREYLLVVQNPSELRGTGGLVKYLAELRVDAGALELRPVDELGVSDDATISTAAAGLNDGRRILDPVDRPAAFADRYDHIAAGAFASSVNADPDFPTVAPVLLRLYAERGGGRDLDGVVLTDPLLLDALVTASGRPLPVPAEVQAPGLPTELVGGQLAQTLLVDTYDVLGGGTAVRGAYDDAVVRAAFETLMAGGWDPVTMVRALGDAAAERHLQLYSRSEEEQAGLVALGLAGHLPSPAAGTVVGDLLAVTGNNAAANKADVHVAHRISGTIALGAVRLGAPADAARTATLRVVVDNPLRPGDHDTYIVGSMPPTILGSPPGERTDDALNRTWFSVWAPEGTEAPALRVDDRRAPFGAGTIHGHRVFDYFLETPSASSASFEIDLDGRAELVRDGAELIYRLTLWRQAKAIPDHWDLTITAPPAWDVLDATVVGGGAPRGMGVGGADGEPIRAVVEGPDDVRVVGAVTRDAVVEVRLGRG